MGELPAAGTSAKEFMEGWFPKAFAEAEIPEETRKVEVTLGVRLAGEGGGEWLLHLDRGQLRVEPGATEPAPFALIQTVEDWRGSLWESRGGIFGRQAALLFQPGAASRTVAAPGAGPGRPLTPAMIVQLQALSGSLRMVVAGGPGGDWKVEFKLGAGPVPAEPTTTITVSAEDAEAMDSGRLDPMQAFMQGRLQVAGDLGFLMQMQAVQMAAGAAS